ncbi:Gamma-aminobutyric acid receptor subunit gamma-3, partial [Ophiophagus hannah]
MSPEARLLGWLKAIALSEFGFCEKNMEAWFICTRDLETCQNFFPSKLPEDFPNKTKDAENSRKVEEDDFDDFTTNQKWVMSPKTHDTDVTLLLNKLLKEYDKKLRPDIGTKPTVIDVDIYVNSIGPVSSINMGNSDLCSKDQKK